MDFLHRFLLAFRGFWAKTSTAAPVSASEPLARFLVRSGQFSRTKDCVKPEAFAPPSDGRLSVYRVFKLIASQIFDLAKKSRPGANVYGFAEILVFQVREVGLNIDPDNDPPRHATVTGWPDGKSARLSLCQKLASKALLRLDPDADPLA